MSNLYKQRFGGIHTATTRVINSNEAVEAKLNELARKLEQEARQNSEFVEGFSEGILAEEVEMVLDEQPVTETITREEADQIIEEANQRAQEIIQEAEAKKDQIRAEAREEGRQQGYQEGNEQAQRELQEEESKLQEYRQELESEYQQKEEELEPMLLNVITQVFEKVFHIQFDDKKDILSYLVKSAIMNIEGSKEFNVRVSEESYAFVEMHKEDILSKVGQNIALNITADSLLHDNECMIETDSGVFDCSLGVQLENLIKDMKCLCL